MDIYREVLSVLDGEGTAVLCTVVHAAGSAPQKMGSKMLVLPDGSIRGTIGGGAVEQATIEQALEVLKTGTARVFKAHLTRDLAMCCGGRMEIFVEPLGVRPWLILFGGGHVGSSLCRIATEAGFRVHVVDERESFCSEGAHPTAEAWTCANPLDVLDDLPWLPESYAVIVTHSHRLDEDLLARCVERDWRYLGMIGSRAKVLRFLDRYRNRGLDMATFSRVHAPIGLDIGAREPGEIAVAVLAEMIAIRRGGESRTFGSMRITEQVDGGAVRSG
ncbi:MAG TPA: xanthine dehydrogenase accessory protein XdhC [Deltaproteobacteria bacterium]|nr:xanthine dehydrogenase accessory protein XdhC [Deltaproteobacteria bacterium]HCP44489.1 xanthine dehydrogenase accessory protein XdhC [Deltaproteobacteria bacterium]